MSWLSIKGGMSSLGNHIRFLLVTFSVPMTLLNIALSYQDQELTWSHALEIAAFCVAGGIVGAFIGWHTIILPMKNRRPK
jgi:uncharacterized membrane protein YfcA